MPWLLLSLCLAASSTAAAAQRYTFSTLGEAAGLSNLNVTNIVETGSGTLWVATQHGVFSADGGMLHRESAFDTLGLAFVISMAPDAQGRIWVTTADALAYVDPREKEPRVAHVIPGVRVAAAELQGIMLAAMPWDPTAMYLLRDGTLKRIGSRDGGSTWQVTPALGSALLASYPQLNHLSSIAVGNSGTIWAGCGQSICEIDRTQGRVRTWDAAEGLAPDRWTGLLLDRFGTLWARGTHSVAMLAAGAGQWSLMGKPPAGTYLDTQYTAMVEDSEGRVLLNLSRGIARIDHGRWESISPAQGLPQDEIDALFFSRSGDLWLAPSGHGLSRWLGYGNWEHWTTNEGLSTNVVWAAQKDDRDRLWITTETGLDVLQTQTRTVRPQTEGFPYHRLQDVRIDARGHLWTGDGLGRVIEFDPGTSTSRIVAQLRYVSRLFLDREQRLWICSRDGLYSVDTRSRERPLTHTHAPFGNIMPTAVDEDASGNLWVAAGGGLYRLSGEAWARIDLPAEAGEEVRGALLAVATDGTLWLQSTRQHPLLHLQVDGGRARLLASVDEAILESDELQFLSIDQRGWVWVGSDIGVDVFNGVRWVHCTTEDGLIWDDTDSLAFFADPNGTVWIGTSGGLSHLLHPESLFKTPAPRVALGEAHLGSVPIVVGANALQSLDLRRPALSVSLVSPNYSRAAAVIFRYRLEGLESAWQQTERQSLRFPALAPGRYKLTVVAYDRSLHTSSPVQSLAFELLEPWWKRKPYIAMEILLGLSVLLAAWRLSVHLLVARQQELERLVMLRTGELEREKKDLLQARSELLEITRRDPLTGLLNRSAIFERMRALCEAEQRGGPATAVVMADLDGFKRINDEHGHQAGDSVLQECARRVAGVTRPVDAVGRYGGEELLILLPGLDPGSLRSRMEEIRVAIAGKPVVHGSLHLQVTCSFGVAWCEGERSSVEELVSLADAALYQAKQNGRNRVEYAHLLTA